MGHLSVGDQVAGRYRLTSFRGKGATGEVYFALDEQTQSTVALKIFSGSQASGPALARFEREASVTMSVSHPNLIRVTDAGTTRIGAPYLVMEALDGETASEFLRREGAMDPALALSFVRDAAGALEVAHDAGIVHRDLKPDNLFLCGPQGAPETVKVLDFGYARYAPGGPLTAQGMVLGTLEYMAPEQVVSEPLDRRSDVYALGGVLFRFLTGELPFETRVKTDYLGHHLFSAAPPPSWLMEDGDGDLDVIVQTAMRKHPGNRYPTMRELAEDITRVLVGDSPFGAPLIRAPDAFAPVTSTGERVIRALRLKHQRAVESGQLPVRRRRA